ncbi:MAG: flagellar M-ring protein FliF [Bryobacter sp.]|nr:flagellar M-ring protein FliF [Bryobacter sp.]
MDQFRNLWRRFTRGQQLSLIAAAVLVAAGIYGFTRWQKEQDFKPLYTGLAPDDAGQVLTRLREQGVEFRVTDGGASVAVPSGRVAELRLDLAAAGLPKTGRIGFELFDATNFGTTDFAEQVNYHRAIEGELERSVGTIASVERARVHVTFPKDSVFLESRQPAKASVMVKLRPGRTLEKAHVAAIQHLAASAVESLSAESVAVLDMQGNLLSRPVKPRATDGGEPASEQLEYRKRLEQEMLAKVDRTLAPLLGEDKYRASVLVDCDFTSGEQSEERFDPDQSVMLTQSRTEDISGAAPAQGVPGTASNLPRPMGRPGSGAAGQVTRRTENISYATSRTVRKTRLPEGVVKRVSLSVLVDQSLRWEGTGAQAKRILEPPPPEKLKTIRDVLTGVMGFDQQRGDQLIVETIPFEATLRAPPPEGPAKPVTAAPVAGPITIPLWIPKPLQDIRILAGIVAGMLLGLVAVGVFFFLRRKKKKRTISASSGGGAIDGGGGGRLEGSAPGEPGKSIEERLAEQQDKRRQLEAEELAKLQLTPVTANKGEILTKHITEEAKKDPASVAQVLRAWLHEQVE